VTTSFIAGTSAEATSVTLPSHQAGDMIVMYAGIVTGTGTITIPSGWRVVCFRAINNTMSSVVAVMTATSGAEVSGTWTSAELLACAVYRDSVNYLRVGGSNQGGANSPTTTITYPAIIPYGLSTSSSSMRATSWVVGFGLSSVNTGSLETPPTDMTNRVTLAGASVGEIAIHDRNAAISTWPSTNVTIDAGNNHAAVIELVDSGYAIASASGGTIFNVIGAA